MVFADPTNNGKNGEVRALLSVPKQGAGLRPRAALFYSEQMCCGGPRGGPLERKRSAECSRGRPWVWAPHAFPRGGGAGEPEPPPRGLGMSGLEDTPRGASEGSCPQGTPSYREDTAVFPLTSSCSVFFSQDTLPPVETVT